jgi:hypothetical protein
MEKPINPFFEFLVRHFTFLGFDFQNWMPIMLGVAALYILYLWKAGF